MDKYQRDFVTNVKYLRCKKGFSQAQFAEACNVATGTIGNIECGIAKPSFDLIITMATVLSVEPAEFFASTEIQNLSEGKGNISIIEEHRMLTAIYATLKTYFEK
ncbi:MAG: helix-turn-helix domain-containing protein [Bacteroides sp.]|nr:helix-turn-helix domain-containing protein [Prevotella sp.]MCM1407007.1 helix-turn-helix domain-containing protein [Treponema brennaborense]MCM1470158.1 helix-turn-helix domain-containing protein [Bacteroides sp.]